MPLPNVLGIGFPRAGTTYLSHVLAEHSDVCFSQRKETHYFQREDPIDAYEHQFSHYTGEHVTMEWTVGYCADLNALKRIRRILGTGVLFLISYRNVIDVVRSYYFYQMTSDPNSTAAKLSQREWFLDLQSSPKRTWKKWRNDTIGRYDEQYNLFRKVFPDSHILIINYDQMIRDKEKFFRALIGQLGIEYSDHWKTVGDVNVSYGYKNRFIDKLLRKALIMAYGSQGANIRYRGPSDKRPVFVKAVQYVNARQKTSDADAEDIIKEHLSPHYEKFEKLIRSDRHAILLP